MTRQDGDEIEIAATRRDPLSLSQPIDHGRQPEHAGPALSVIINSTPAEQLRALSDALPERSQTFADHAALIWDAPRSVL